MITDQLSFESRDRMEQRLVASLGPSQVISGRAVAEKFVGWPDAKPCMAAMIVRPRSTEDVSRIVALCAEFGISLVPYGGGTGLVDGTECSAHSVMLDMSLLNQIEEVNSGERYMIVYAGVPLQTVQEKAAENNLYFPVDIGARGSATIGGMVSTNAGGNRVVRFGMMRENILGLEVVLADGEVLSSLNTMLKNNTGYDLKQLFIGSEGTLGVVTKACIRLHPHPGGAATALLSLPAFGDVLALLKLVGSSLGGSMSAFEVMWPEFYKKTAGASPPLAPLDTYYVLIEAVLNDSAGSEEIFEAAMMQALEQGIASDGVLAKSEAETRSLWAIRDGVEHLSKDGPVVMFDVSVPLSKMQTYIDAVRGDFERVWPGRPVYAWGHLADSNLHIWASLGDENEDTRKAAEAIVYGRLRSFRGSVSGEHGIGLEKLAYLDVSRSAEEIRLMKRLKTCLDPQNILNPGKVIS